MKSCSASSADACREQALSLLNRRSLTVAELQRELQRQHYAQAEILPVIQDLIRLHLLDDAIIADHAVQNNRHSSRPIGTLKLRRKLLLRGVPEMEIDRALRDGEAGDTPDETDYRHAQIAAQQKIRALSRLRDQRSVMMKLYRHLAGRGFPPDICRTVVREITTSGLEPEDDPA